LTPAPTYVAGPHVRALRALRRGRKEIRVALGAWRVEGRRVERRQVEPRRKPFRQVRVRREQLPEHDVVRQARGDRRVARREVEGAPGGERAGIERPQNLEDVGD